MADWLARHKLNGKQLKAVLHEILRAIDHLQSKNIVHCDIKLENVFMTSDFPFASPKLGDFDISKDNDIRTRDASMSTVFGGTHVYIAPELIDRKAASKASDIYAFGVLMFLSMSSNRGRYSSTNFVKTTSRGANGAD